jgi:hypothetical protein
VITRNCLDGTPITGPQAAIVKVKRIRKQYPGIRSAERSKINAMLLAYGSYLTDAYHGDIRRREEVSAHLALDVRQGAHARKVMDSYKSWLGEGPELSVLRILGLLIGLLTKRRSDRC